MEPQSIRRFTHVFAKDCPVQESGRSESATTGKNGRELESNGVVAWQPGEKKGLDEGRMLQLWKEEAWVKILPLQHPVLRWAKEEKGHTAKWSSQWRKSGRYSVGHWMLSDHGT